MALMFSPISPAIPLASVNNRPTGCWLGRCLAKRPTAWERRVIVAITPEHYELADSVRSLVARLAPSRESFTAALGAPSKTRCPLLAGREAEQRLAGCASGQPSRSAASCRHLQARGGACRVRLAPCPSPFVPSAIASALIATRHCKVCRAAAGTAIAAYALDSGLMTATRHGDVLVIRGGSPRSFGRGAASVLNYRWPSKAVTKWVVLRNDQLEIRSGQEQIVAAHRMFG